ncbi:MAG: hypothetical protein Q9195_008056 [Heterodermia aff. obscurata]
MQRPKSRRSYSYALKISEAQDEEERFLPDAEHGDSSGSDVPVPPNPHAHLPVYATIHRIHQDIISAIDDPYSLEQLRSPRMNVSIIRPMVERLYKMKDVSIVYCLLINKVHFIREQTHHAHRHNINNTRANTCELLANRVLRRFEEEHTDRNGLLLLANILVAGFEPFQNAPAEILKSADQTANWVQRVKYNYKKKAPALEVAILSESKILLSSSACARVVDAIYTGRLIYTPYSFIDILPDHYKHKPISLYNPAKAPLLNQYRLIVPRISNALDMCQFLVLLFLYILVMTDERPKDRRPDFTVPEVIFTVYALGWALHEFATILEHGWQVYTQNLWSFLDASFAVIYVFYLFVRIYGYGANDIKASRTALEILATGAPVLVPRLAFNLMSENMLFVSLRDMMANFVTLTLLAVWCFAGFLLAMVWLGDGSHKPVTVSKWMLYVWFGLDGTGIQRSLDFHWLLGPSLMVTFAFLGNTLFLTILVSMLSNTFSSIVTSVDAECQFRKAVLTLEGVKSDAIFAYQPPLNVLALIILLPLKMLVSPRWFHKVNVTAVRVTNLPILLAIAWYERRYLWRPPKTQAYRPRKRRSWWDFSRFSVHGDIQAVFETDPPDYIYDDDSDLEPSSSEGLSSSSQQHANGKQNRDRDFRARRLRKGSAGSVMGLTEQLSDMLHEHHGSSIKGRLEKLEASNRRIEFLLRKLYEDGGGDSGKIEEVLDEEEDDDEGQPTR